MLSSHDRSNAMNWRTGPRLGIGILCLLLPSGAALAADSAAVKALFANPPRQYASAPLWVWNDMLTDEQVVDTLRDLAGQKVKQAFVHPRPGLMTPYLSDQWFRLWKVALAEAERLDMNLWIYDENSYPSGFAGGWVPEVMPEARGRGLVFREVTRVEKPGEEVVGVYRLTDSGYEDVTSQARCGQALADGKYLVAAVQRAGNSPWHGGRCYVDLMYPGVTEKFLEVTLEAYRKHIGQQFGQRVPGAFTDEPNVRPAGGLPWTDHLPQEFEKRWGYKLTDHLPSLSRPVGDWRRVRHNYFQVVLEQFIEHWGKPYYDYCAKNNLAFTGHYWDHEWPNCVGVPDNMAMAAWQQMPGIDCLMNQYREDTHAQFGNVRMVRELASVANQLGRQRILCEIYGAGGWDLRFEDMKRIGDWLEVLGVNFLDEHLSYVTLRGARKHDHPQSFSYHEPWWDSYHVMAQYFTRLSAALSQGQQVNHILVIPPTTTAWMYQNDGSQAKKLDEIGNQFFDFLMKLERLQVDYDLGCEDVIARHGSVKAPSSPQGRVELAVGQRSYERVVLPAGIETLNIKTVELLEAYVKAGGLVFCHGPAPALVDGRPSDRLQKLAQSDRWQMVDPAKATETPFLFNPLCRYGSAIRRAKDDKGNLFHHRRQLDDGELLLLVNTSLEAHSTGTIRFLHQGAEQWDLHGGTASPYPCSTEPQLHAAYELPPCGSLLLFFPKKERQTPPAEAKAPAGVPVAPVGPMQIRRVEPNVLTIDYFDVAVGKETLQSVNFYKACQFAFQKNGMERNPWDSAVQFKDELISKKFPAESGVEATYHFTIEGDVPKPLWIVIERPDLYTVTCNGQPVAAAKDAWWLDRAFGKIDLTAAARSGENAVTIKAAPFTIYHELQSAYVLGDFSLRPAEKGFVIGPAKPLALGRWNEQGHPFYATGVAYSQKFDVGQPKGRYRLAVPAWYGSVAKVLVNGKPAGHLVSQPWECDVTDALQPGENSVELVVIGTLKNTLGPHHGNPPLGTAWPASFRRGPEVGPPPGAQYSTVGYGLLEPFRLERVEK
jgi:hypothetical protein